MRGERNEGRVVGWALAFLVAAFLLALGVVGWHFANWLIGIF